jgi:hypothetical protein
MYKGIILKVFLILAMVFLSSCREYFVTTKVNADGTVERTISIKDDKAAIDSLSRYFKAQGWEVKYENTDSKNSDSKTITATRKYSTPEEVNGNSAKIASVFKPEIDIKIDKHFRFFFTYYSYTETYKAYEIYSKVPLTKIFSPEEITKLKNGSDSLWTKQKIELYNGIVLFDIAFDEMKESLAKSPGIDLTKFTGMENRMSFYLEVARSNGKDEELIKIISKYSNDKTANEIMDYFSSDKNKNTKTKLIKMDDSLSAFKGSYENTVVLPGIITSSNSKSVKGNELFWKFDQDMFKFFDYEMTGESREVNTWVLIISAIVVLLLALLLILPKLRKKPAF